MELPRRHGFEIDHFEIGVENRQIPESVFNSEERCCGSDFKSAIVTADGPGGVQAATGCAG